MKLNNLNKKVLVGGTAVLIILMMIALTYWIDHAGEIRVQSKYGVIYGTLLKPVDNPTKTLVILVAGSGPTDRDGNSTALKGKNDSHKALAYGLKEQGFATFRFDQRSSGETWKKTKLKNIDSFSVFVDDLINVIQTLKKEQSFDRIVLVGHSQGAMVATLAAQVEPVDGLVILAGASQPIDEVLLWQIKQQNMPGYDEMEKIVGQLKQGKTVDKISADAELIFRRSVQEFLISWMRYDPYVEIKKLKIPLLFLYGSQDMQVPPAGIPYWKELTTGENTVVFQGMNHVLKEVNNEKDNVSSYSDPSFSLHPEIVNTIVKYINELK